MKAIPYAPQKRGIAMESYRNIGIDLSEIPVTLIVTV